MKQATAFSILFAYPAAVYGSPQFKQAPTTVPTDILEAHNSVRRNHQVPDLTWDATLATNAQNWGSSLQAQGCAFKHGGHQGQGQNLAMGYPNWASAVQGWSDEVSLYNFSKPGWQPAAGHFTQVVWKATTKVGCSYTHCSANGMTGIYNCHYLAPGNFMSRFAENVFPYTLRQSSLQQAAPVLQTATQQLSPTQTEILKAHNSVRAQHAARDLIWSDQVASKAQAWANQLALNGCAFAHGGNEGQGQNLAAGYSSWTAAVGAWTNEAKVYNFSKPGWQPAAGHFTQVVWKSTTHVGCGYTSCLGMNMKGRFVCHYSPPGNYLNSFAQNVS